MKIAMIGQKGIPALYGGIERHVEELSRELAKQGHEILVYARSWYTAKTIKKYLGIRVLHIPTIRTKHLDAIIHTFLSTIHALKEKPDVIHYHGVGPALLSFIPRIFSPRTKVVTTFHCVDRYHQKWNWFARLMLRFGEKAACIFPHRTIVVSKTIQNYCINEYQKNTDYIPNGVDISTATTTASLLYQWNLEPNKYLLMVSRLVQHKGAHYLIDAWQTARQKNPELLKDYKLVIVGDSAFTDNYVQKIKKMSRGDQSIVFTGWQNGQSLTELFANATMLVHPSENEGLSLSVLRAMSLGKAVLVSDIPEQQEIISDKRFWFANADTISLSEKISELLKNPEWMTEAGEKNRTLVKNNYAWKDIANNTERLYKENNELKKSLVFKTYKV